MGIFDEAANRAENAQAEQKRRAALKAEQKEREKLAHIEAVKAAAGDLDAFLSSSDGESAIRLLYATGKVVMFGNGKDVASVHLSGTGLIALENSYTALSSSVRPTTADSQAAARAYLEHGRGQGKDPHTIVDWLIAELTRIAGQVPR
jgi:hypothetical protein